MAGVNKQIKEGQVLFSAGEPADCMYIVRKGTLKVYFNKGTEEVTLAVLQDGAIVGEMAFFDDKPRSASVKALAVSEVTQITRSDFEKLVTQVPKWVVSMMQSLSGRLRTTNEKLQAIESKALKASFDSEEKKSAILPNQKHPFLHTVRCIKLLLLSLNKDGTKEGKEFLLSQEYPTLLVKDIMGDEGNILPKVIKGLEALKFISVRTDAHKNTVFAFSNRGTLVNFVDFLQNISQKFSADVPFFSDDAIELFAFAVEQSLSSGYESVQFSVLELGALAPKKNINPAQWLTCVDELAAIPEIKLTKNGPEVLFKIHVKFHRLALSYIRYIQILIKCGLA